MANNCLECGKNKGFFAYNYAGFDVRRAGAQVLPDLIEPLVLPGAKDKDFLCAACANKRKVMCRRHGEVQGRFGFGAPPACQKCATEAASCKAGQHEWERYRCQICGSTRPEDATIPTWDPIQSALLEHQYLAENPCLCGGTWKMLTHSSPIPSGTSEMVCQCSKCGAKQVFLFHLRQPAPESPRSDKAIDSQQVFESVGRGDLASVTRLLEQDPSLVGARGSKGMTPLHMAAIRCQQSVARLLLEKGADVNARKDDGWTPLHHASQIGDAALATILLDHGADPALRSQGGQTPLHTAAYGMSETTIRTLETEWTVTHREERPKIDPESVVRLLIARGADINATEPQHGATALHLAIFQGQRAAVRGLLDCGSDLNAKAKGWTPLHFAAARCDEEIVRMLVGKGAGVTAPDDNGRVSRQVIGLACQSCDPVARANLEKLLSPST